MDKFSVRNLLTPLAVRRPTIKPVRGLQRVEQVRSGYVASATGHDEIEYTYEDLAKAYTSFPWFAIGIQRLMDAIVQVPLIVTTRDGTLSDAPPQKTKGTENANAKIEHSPFLKTVVNSGPIYDLFQRPNPDFGLGTLLRRTIGYMCLSQRGAFWLIGDPDEERQGKAPNSFWPIRPDHMRPVYAKEYTKGIDHFEYQRPDMNEPKLYPKDSVWFFPSFDPLDLEPGGIGPATQDRRDIAVEDEAAVFNLRHIRYGFSPGVIVSSDFGIGEKELQNIVKQMEDSFRGARGSWKAYAPPPGVKIEGWGQRPSDMQYIEQRRYNRETFLASFGVPPSIAGLTEASNFNQMAAESENFWYYGVMPYGLIIQEQINHYLWGISGSSNRKVIFDWIQVPAFRGDEEKLARINRLNIEFDLMTVNQVRDRVYRMGPVEWGDMRYTEILSMDQVKPRSPDETLPAPTRGERNPTG